jgi:serine/threonine-protein kinase
MTDILLGRTLGMYYIQAQIGQGGMGTVYYAIDLRNRRPVALKVLASHLSQDPALVQRFWAEYQTIRGLYHPNIVRVYEFGQSHKHYFIAAEYIKGISLEQRLARGKPLKLKEVVAIVHQIATALDAVHPRGIIHCDLKPSNVLIERGGRVVLTDFGIASIGGRHSGSQGWWGTPQYMAPEQVRGMPLTHRVDIYALGVMTYEMLTGRVPFCRDDPWATMYAHVHETPPPLRSVPGGERIPVEVERVVMQALQKDPAQRPPTAGIFAHQLADAARIRVSGGLSAQPILWPQMPAPSGPVTPPRTTSVGRVPSVPHLLWMGIALVGIALFLAAIMALPGSRARFGTVAYACQQGSEVHLCMQDDLGRRQKFILGTQDWSPTWSPDGRYIALTSNKEGNTSVWVLEPTTGRAVPLSGLPLASSSPSWSPDGQAIAFDVQVSQNDYDIYVQWLDEPFPEVLTSHVARDSDPAWSPDGHHIAFVSTRDGDMEIYVMSAEGGDITRLTYHSGWDFAPAWSPNGQQIAYECEDDAEGDIEICVMDTRKAERRVLTKNQVDDRQPAWSPDSRFIAFCRQRTDGFWDIWVMDASGAHQQVWIRDEYSNTHPSWKP